jgi:hypothetical protein
MRRHCAPTALDPSGPVPATAPAAPPAPVAARGIRLAPAEAFPTALAELEQTDLQVLHSRICCQLEHEYLTTPAGPHPVTLDRRNDLVAELSTRQDAPSTHPLP